MNKKGMFTFAVALAAVLGFGSLKFESNSAKEVKAEDSGIAATDGTFVLDFYDSTKLSSTSGTDLSASNYVNFLKVYSGLTKSEVVTGISKSGTVQYGKNGGLTAGASKSTGSVTFNIGTDYKVTKCTAYCTSYDSGSTFKLNDTAASSGSIGTKGSAFASVADPLIWNFSSAATSLSFVTTAKRATIYALVCEYSAGSSDTPSVTINSSSNNKSLDIGDTFTFTATKENATDATITWSSSNTSVATIDSLTGEATAIAAGSTTIKASITVGDVEYKSETTLKVNYPEPTKVENATVSSIEADTAEDQTKKYSITGTIVGWGTSGTAAEKNGSGDMVISDGTKNIIVYGCTSTTTRLTWDGTNGKYIYTRNSTFNSASETKDLTIGSRVTLDAIRIHNNGTVELSAIYVSGTIEELKSITATPTKTVYDQGQAVAFADFSVVGTYAVAGNVDIASSDCTISPSKLNNAGTTTVTITYGGKSSSYDVTVNAAEIDLEMIVIDDSISILTNNPTKKISLLTEPENYTEAIIWESSDESVATVDSTGIVNALKPGTATITCRGEKGNVSETCTVTVAYGASYKDAVTDVFDLAASGVTSGSYTEFADVSLSSSAKYAGKTLKTTKNNADYLQFNKDKGELYTTVSGGVFKGLSLELAATNSDANLEVYGSNSSEDFATLGDYANGTYIGEISCDTLTGEISCSEEYGYIYIRPTGTIVVNSISIKWNSTIKASAQDMKDLKEYIETFIDVGGEYDAVNNPGTGECITSNWYADAKEFFNGLTNNQKCFFMNDDYFANQKARLLAWANANGETFNADTKQLSVKRTEIESEFTFDEENSNVAILAVTSLSMATLGALYLLKKKRVSE